MEVKALLKVTMVMVMVVGGCRGEEESSFKDCYAKCFIFCMIEPKENLCTCSTLCLKECIFPSLLPSSSSSYAIDQHSQNLGYCKLGCATSLCSNISKTHNPEKMEVKALLKVTMVMVMVVGDCRGEEESSFKDCYAKCFIFCMIEPKENLCTCSTLCLKECIFPSLLPSSSSSYAIDQHSQNLGYCKLGCATSLCSNISKTHNPDGKNMEICVGSCSNKCTMSYLSSSP
ncbi:hypothetical protein OSB04_030546 [Centaurea solstitialis]|uniref:Thionin-like protein 2 n=1 Tax=Centaurea solstitialis TaxID=347529 RepID=A0AA38SFD3_9ASTR|nr:hypothetical protein OSB04_030546 [Centaurea solstitialis]